MSAITQDLTHAMRGLWRTPGFTAVAVLTLALGIAATTTLVNVVDTLMLRPPAGVRNANRIVRPYFRFQASFGSWTGATVSYPDFTDLRDKVPAFEGVAAYYETAASLGVGREARPVNVYGVTGEYFALLGVQAWKGRLLEPAEDSLGHAMFNAVVSASLWRTALAADPNVIGRVLSVGRDRFTVVGVTRPEFAGTELAGPGLWVPMGTLAPTFAGNEFASERRSYFIRMIARLRPDVSSTVAAAQATAAIGAGRADPKVNNGFQEVTLGPVQEARGPEAGRQISVALWLVGVSAMVLLVACANVGNLLLHRGLARGRELGIRKALGASQWSVVRLLLVESVLLGVLSGCAALLLAVWGGGAVRHFLLPAGSGTEFTFDARLFVFAFVVSLGAGLIAGVMPAWRNAGADLGLVLKEGSRGAGYRRSPLRDGLVVAQMALSLLLVVGAGLFSRSLRNALALDIGFDIKHVMILTTDLGAAGYPESDIQRAFAAMQDAVRRDPAVKEASLSVGGPFGWGFATSVRLPGRDSAVRVSSGPYFQSVDPTYRQTVGLALLQGRDLASTDRQGSPKVALVGHETARMFWPDRSPLGQCMYLGDDSDCTEVVGVVENGRRNEILEDPQLMLYLPLEQSNDRTRGMTLFVRTRNEARMAVPSVRALAQAAFPAMPYVRAQSMGDVIAPQYDAWRMGATMFGLFGALALILATVGVYSSLAYVVRGRTRELGIRVALGASDPQIVKLLARDAVRLVAIGLGAGLLLALAGGRALASLLYGVGPADPFVLSASAGLLAAAALVASVVPARRAVRVSPIVALRSE